MNLNIRRLWAQSLCILVAFSVTGVNAQQIEEIVVTAQKRAQNQQDVPVALDAFTGEMLQQSSIKTMRDLAGMTPSLTSFQSQNAGFSSWGIRSINTSSQNYGLESAVGSYVDNVYRARQSAIANQLVDVEAVEILRGPQGTLFGKNTSAGAINIRTVAPGHDRNGFFEIVGGDYGLVNVNAAANLSISDKLAMRATVFTSDRDGFVTNLSEPNGEKLNNRDRQGSRIQFLYEPSDRTSMRLIMDYAEVTEICCAALTKKNNLFHTHTGAVVPGTDFLISHPTLGMGFPITLEADFNKQEVYLNHLPKSNAEDKGLSLEINRDYDNFTLTSVSAIRNFDTDDFADVDFGAAPIITDHNKMEQSSFSQELRLSGEFNTGGSRDGHFQVGFYYYSQDIDNNSKLQAYTHTAALLDQDPTLKALKTALSAVHDGVQAGTVAAITASPTTFGLPAGVDAATITAAATAANPYSPLGVTFPNGSYATDIMSQDHKSYAFFGQVDLPIQEHWTLTAGLRYTNEDKDLHGTFPTTIPTNTDGKQGPVVDVVSTSAMSPLWALGALQLGALNAVTDAAIIAPIFAPFYSDGWGFYVQPSLAPHADENHSIEDSRVTGNIKIAYQPSDNMMYYGSYSTGYKAGGTNTDRLGPGLGYTFDPETIEVLEVGAKMDLMDTLRINWAAFKMEVDDLQTSTFAGNAFNLQNAGMTEGSGAEMDIIWQPTDSTTLNVSYAKVVATVKDFPNATCWIATPWHTGKVDPGAAGADPDADFCDHSGVSQGEPEDNIFVGLTQGFKLGDTTGYVRLEHQSISESDTFGAGDPMHFRESFTFANARVGFIFEELNSELAFWVRNATDERFYESVFNNPVQAGSLRAYTSEPRTWGVNFRMDFD